MGFLNPLGLTPPPVTVHQSPGQTLTGRDLPPTPRTLTFETGAPEAEEAGRLLSVAGPAGRVAGYVGGRIASGARTAAEHVARNAAPYGLGTAGVTTLAGTGQTEPPPPPEPPEIVEARGRVTRITADQDKLRTDLADLRTASELFSPERLDRTNRQAVMAAQRALQGAGLYLRDSRGRQLPIDGIWGPGMSEAVAEYLRLNRERQSAIGTELRDLNGQFTTENTRLTNLLRQTNRDRVERDAPWFDRFIHQYAGPLGVAAGLVGGLPIAFPVRAAAARSVNAATERAVTSANRLLDRPRGDIPGRMAGVNRFYAEGGGAEPFRLAPRGRGGFTETRPPPSTADLYPPRSGLGTWVQPVDAAIGAGSVASIGIAEVRLHQARQELEESRRAADANGSPENMERLRRAEARVDWVLLTARALEGAPVSYIPAAATYRYSSMRPDVQRAEAEVGRLSRWRRRQ